jgi:hypothetical protein
LMLGCIPALIVAFCQWGFQAVRKRWVVRALANQTEFALLRPALRTRWGREPKFLLGFDNVQLAAGLFSQDHKNVAAGLSARPI